MMKKVLPNSFVYLSSIDPTIQKSIRCASTENFSGNVVRGYENAKDVIIKEKAARQLKEVQAYMRSQGYTLVIYDAYRPRRAVEYFVEWSKNSDASTRDRYYPTLEKGVLFENGYISKTSSHCKGFTADLTIMPLGAKLHNVVISKRTLKNGEEISFLDDGTVDMGTSFDCFHEASHPDSELVTPEQQANRKILRDAMLKNGFEPLETEWWHFTLAKRDTDEAYDFPVE